MRKMLIILSLLSFSLSFAQIEKSLGDFDKIKVSDKIEVRLVKSEENRIEIAGENAEEVNIITNNNQLKIKMNITEFLKGDDVVIHLYYKSLQEVLATEGAIISSEETFKTNSLKLRANKGAEIDLDVEVVNLEVTTNSGGSVVLNGTAEKQEVVSNTGGFYDGEELISKHTKVTVNAGGAADVYASEKVDAKTRAGGEIHIWGPAEINTTKIVGGNIEVHR
ncbi:MAG TPA: head GIN domain-containing protein [Flavobacteriaceae bacterium]|nr:head GIN domain-containing protein [Flavobacteriaceae bacterium]